jgi:Tol biopolymer transport system component
MPGALLLSASAWSPDGQRITFYNSDSYSIYVVNADGTGLASLVSLPSSYYQTVPAWSPDGSEFEYLVCRGISCFVEAVTVDGGTVRVVSQYR